MCQKIVQWLPNVSPVDRHTKIKTSKSKLHTPKLGSKTTPSKEVDVRDTSEFFFKKKENGAILIVDSTSACFADKMLPPLTKLKVDCS